MSLLTNNVAYYKFSSGAYTTDSAGSFTLTSSGSNAQTASGFLGSGTQGDSIHNGVNMGITGTSDMSMSFWVKFTGGAVNSGMFFFGSTSGSDRFLAMDMNSSGSVTFYNSNNSSSGSAAVSPGSVFNHVVITRTTTAIDVWWNNTKVISAATQGSATGGQDNLSLCTGKSFGGDATQIIDECGVWTRALTSGEVSQLYNSGAGLQYPYGLLNASSGNMSMMGI